MPLERLRIEDFSDREFLLVMLDVADNDGWTDSDALKERLDLSKRAIASSRLSWLYRYGAVEREHERDDAGNIRYYKNGRPRYTQRWRMTDVGYDLAAGRLRKRQAESLDKIEDAQMLEVMAWVTDRARHADDTVWQLIRREYRYGMSPLRNGR
jgi:hypothetical protein